MPQRLILTGYKLIALQLIMLSIAAIICIFIYNWRSFISVLLGGIAWIIPSLYFVYKLFNPKTIFNLKALPGNFFLGEGIKLLLSAGLIILIIFIFPIEIKSFLSGYIVVIAASVLMPFLDKKKVGKVNG